MVSPHLYEQNGHGRAEADAEGLDVDVAPLGGEEVAELVDEDDEPRPTTTLSVSIGSR